MAAISASPAKRSWHSAASDHPLSISGSAVALREERPRGCARGKLKQACAACVASCITSRHRSQSGQARCACVLSCADKNATAKKRRDVYIPDKVRALRIRCVDMLEDYLRREKPPSGGLLLAAPVGRTRFRDTPYSNHHAAFRAAYKQAFPEADDAGKFGSGSARKAMAQWLWASGWAKRVIADAGGWFCKKSAVDQYFKTQPRDILRAIRSVGLTRGQNRR